MKRIQSDWVTEVWWGHERTRSICSYETVFWAMTSCSNTFTSTSHRSASELTLLTALRLSLMCLLHYVYMFSGLRRSQICRGSTRTHTQYLSQSASTWLKKYSTTRRTHSYPLQILSTYYEMYLKYIETCLKYKKQVVLILNTYQSKVTLKRTVAVFKKCLQELTQEPRNHVSVLSLE